MVNKKLLSAAIAGAVLFSASYEAIAEVKMGVFPRRPVAMTHKLFRPLAKTLEDQLGEKVKLIVAKDFNAFWEGVKNEEYDLVHYNQYHYIKSHAEHDYRVIVANEERGNKKIAGALSVRKDSGINSVEDLKGKTLLFGGGPKAMGSYIAPTWILKKAGLQPEEDYTVKFAKNPPSAVIAVYGKAADAAGSGNVVLDIGAVTNKIDVSKMKILAESEPFTHLCWAVRGDMSDAKASKIQGIMTSLGDSAEGKKVLESAKVTDFYAVTDADYDKVRDITEYAVGQRY